MRLPSIQRLMAGARASAERFPLVLICALIAALGAMRMVEPDAAVDDLRIVAAACLGLPLLTGLTLFAERRNLAAWQHWALQALGLLVPLLFYLGWPGWTETGIGFRFLHLNASLHLLVAFVAYIGVRETKGFWQFNRTLFFRFGLGAIYTYVLWGGLSIALFGIDNLFNLAVDEANYARLFFLLGFVFQTWFVLAGVPADFDELDRRDDYPAGLRVFAQYVLLPLVAVYVVILSAYLARVVITTTWPSGWIGYLVSALAAFGIFSLLLVHPRRGSTEHAWIDRYARAFWIAILPSAAMLLLAVGQRIGQYGITEPRYMLLALAVWLAGTALFFAVTRSRRIRGIPLSLAVIGFVTLVGPWSAYSVAERSQAGRLEGLLQAHGVLAGGRLAPDSMAISNEDWRQVGDILQYLVERHGTGAIEGWFEGGLATVDPAVDWSEPATGLEVVDRARAIADYLELVPAGGLLLDPGGFVELSPVGGRGAALPVDGFERVVSGVNLLSAQRILDGDTLSFAATADSLGTVLRYGGGAVATANFGGILARAERSGSPVRAGVAELPADSLVIEVSGAMFDVRIHVAALRIREMESGALRPVRATGTVLLRRRTSGMEDAGGPASGPGPVGAREPGAGPA